MATFVHDGNTIDYTPATDVAAGDVVVQGELIGVAKVPIPADKLGALAVTGVFDFRKATGAGEAIGVGANAYWDETNQQATTTATGNKLIGRTVAAAGDDDETIRVRWNQ